MTINDIIHDLRMAENLARECDEYYDMDRNLREIGDIIENSINSLETILEIEDIIQELRCIQSGIERLV